MASTISISDETLSLIGEIKSMLRSSTDADSIIEAALLDFKSKAQEVVYANGFNLKTQNSLLSTKRELDEGKGLSFNNFEAAMEYVQKDSK